MSPVETPQRVAKDMKTWTDAIDVQDLDKSHITFHWKKDKQQAHGDNKTSRNDNTSRNYYIVSRKAEGKFWWSVNERKGVNPGPTAGYKWPPVLGPYSIEPRQGESEPANEDVMQAIRDRIYEVVEDN